MKETFCERCGILISEAEDCCPFCKRKVDWSTGKQLDQVQSVREPNRERFPQKLFQQEPVQPEPKEEEASFRPTQVAADKSGRSDFLKPLNLGEMILLALCAVVPIIGTALLALAAFVGEETEHNRKTAARGLLIVQLVLIVAGIFVAAAIISFFISMSYSSVPTIPRW